jgi:Family of unknown function (DUF5996)
MTLTETTSWPELAFEEWRDTRETLHMYTQVIGKLRLALSPFEPEWAHVPLYVSARGLTTSPVPVGHGTFEAEFDFIANELVMRSSDGNVEHRPLGGSVADFYQGVMGALKRMDIHVELSVVPSEVSNPIPFPEDRTHDTYDPDQAARFHQVLSKVDVVFKEHRAHFRGKTSPVQFFWGTFDLALNRYSGKAIEPDPNAGVIARVGGDAEMICAGWWPGDERVSEPAFFAHTFPAADGLDQVQIQPGAGGWNTTMGEFVLPYDAVRASDDPGRAVHQFLDSTYEGAAKLLGWDDSLTQVVAPTRTHPSRRASNGRHVPAS